MKNEELDLTHECPAKKHTAKTWASALILGFFIGLAIIAPGISGSTIAIIFGLYAGMLYAIGNIVGDFKRCFAFLLPIGIGGVIGFLAGFLVLRELFDLYLIEVVFLFVGFMIGAMPVLTKEIKHQEIRSYRVVLFVVGFFLPILTAVLSVVLSGGGDTETTFTELPAWRIPLYALLGAVVSVTQIVPGLSATAILMAFGQFKPILNSLHREYISEHPAVLLLYAALAIGFLLGIVLISRLFDRILRKHKVTTFFAVTGMAVGSILSMLCNADMVGLYRTWIEAGSLPITRIVVAVCLLAVGFVSSLLLARYEMAHGENEKQGN